MCLFSSPKKRNKRHLKRLEKSVLNAIRRHQLPTPRKHIKNRTSIPSEILSAILIRLTSSGRIEFCKVRDLKTGRFSKMGYRIIK